MANFLIGAVTTTGFLFLLGFIRQKKIELAWWEWALTVLGFVYVVFVLEVIVSFVDEGTVKGAWVMGLILGFFAFVWGISLFRFVYAKKLNLPAKLATAGKKD